MTLVAHQGSMLKQELEIFDLTEKATDALCQILPNSGNFAAKVEELCLEIDADDTPSVDKLRQLQTELSQLATDMQSGGHSESSAAVTQVAAMLRHASTTAAELQATTSQVEKATALAAFTSTLHELMEIAESAVLTLLGERILSDVESGKQDNLIHAKSNALRMPQFLGSKPGAPKLLSEVQTQIDSITKALLQGGDEYVVSVSTSAECPVADSTVELSVYLHGESGVECSPYVLKTDKDSLQAGSTDKFFITVDGKDPNFGEFLRLFVLLFCRNHSY